MSSPEICAARAEHDHLRPQHCIAAADFMIYLTAPGLDVMPMRVMASDSIAAVKLRVQTSKGVVVRKQKLVFGGRELARNECRIRDYGVGDGNVLHLVIRISDLRLITVETVQQGRRFSFRVEPGRTVGYLKHQLIIASSSSSRRERDDQKSKQIRIRLILEGEELDDGHLIHDVCRTDGAVIHLLIDDASGAQLVPLPRKDDIGIEPVVVAGMDKALEDVIDAVLAGMDKGNAPVMSSEGTGGAYLMMREQDDSICIAAVFKPVDEEPMAPNNPRGLPVSCTGQGLKKGTRVGEGAFREVAAYLLDHGGFAGVPPTALVRCMHPGFFIRHRQPHEPPVMKLGSLQAFVTNCGSCEDMGPRAFPVQEVHKISVLDMRLANTDRHPGNILVRKGIVVSLVPIDHGYCLPESLEDCTFEWLYWPQSRVPFTKDTTEYIASLDADEDIAILKRHGWEISSQCARTLRVATMLLKKGVERGLTAFDVGSLMCRETLTKESTIEEMVRQALDDDPAAADDDEDKLFLQALSEIMDRRLDKLTSDQK